VIIDHFRDGKLASPHWMIPTITPNNPSALPKISITSILTNVSGVWASLRAQPLPVIPTQIPHTRLETPTDIPVQRRDEPANQY